MSIVAPGNAWGNATIKVCALKGHFNKVAEMAHSFCKIYVHIIFSTKDRQCWLVDIGIKPLQG